MMSMPRVRTIFGVGLLLAGLSGCSSVFLNTPVAGRGDGFAVTLSEVKEGADEYPSENVVFTPDKGDRFIWTFVTVRSELGSEQEFSYKSCTLEGKGYTRHPMIVDKGVEIFSTADDTENFDAGQERTRRLIFSFAKDQKPTRMKCGAIALAIPAR